MRPADHKPPILRAGLRGRLRAAAVAPVVAAVTVVTAAVAAFAFALTAHGLFGFARTRMQLPAWLAACVPFAVDLGSVCAIVAAYALRHAPARVRVYCWLAFAATVALSVSGNEAYAVARHLPLDGRIGAAAPPLLLALTAHLLIIVRRHADRRAAQRAARTAAAGTTRRESKTDADRPDVPDLDRPRGDRPGPAADRVDHSAPGKRRQNQLDPRAALAAGRVLRGESPADVAAALTAEGERVSTRAVQRWAGLARAGRIAVLDQLDQPVNGARVKIALHTDTTGDAGASPDGGT